MPGRIVADKLRRGGRGEVPADFYLVLPNRDHDYRQLCPMTLGPVMTGETKFPVSQTLENYWQGSKVFGRDLDAGGNVGSVYALSKRLMYNNLVGKRHKYSRGMRPLYTIYFDKEREVRYEYAYLTNGNEPVEARKFYCCHYAYLAKKQPQYQELLNRLKRGENLLIKGYDASLIDSQDANLQAIINRHYGDSSEPFGHEKVLFTMLCFDLELIETVPWPDLQVHKLYEPGY